MVLYLVLCTPYTSFPGVCKREYRGQQSDAGVGSDDDDRFCCHEAGVFDSASRLQYTQVRQIAYLTMIFLPAGFLSVGPPHGQQHSFNLSCIRTYSV